MNIRRIASILVVVVIAVVVQARTHIRRPSHRTAGAPAAYIAQTADEAPPTVVEPSKQDTPESLERLAGNQVRELATLEMAFYKAHEAFALDIQLLGFKGTPGMSYYFTPDTSLGRQGPRPRIEIAVYNPIARSTCKPQESGAHFNSIEPGTIDVSVSCQQGDQAYAESEMLPPPGYERYFRR